MAKPYKLVYVKWLDSRQPTSRWQFTEDLDADAITCESVGWLIRDKKKVKLLAPNIGNMNQVDEQASGVIDIPTCSIVEIKEIDTNG